VPPPNKNTEIGDKLLQENWAAPTRTQNVEEPTTNRPPPAPDEVIARQTKIDPWDLVKDKRFRVDLSKLLRDEVSTDPEQETVQNRHAVRYLLFDNYFDYLCTGELESIGVPRLDGQEQAMYFLFYRFSYGYGYSACPMSEATLMGRLDWVRKHVKRVRQRLLDKKVVEELKEFPLFRSRRPQVYAVRLPRQIVEQVVKDLQSNLEDHASNQRRQIPDEAKRLIDRFLGRTAAEG